MNRTTATRILPSITLAVLATACASTGATLNSGVGDKFMDEPPFYAGRDVRGDSARIVHLPLGFQRGAMQAPVFEPDATDGSPMAQLMGEMNEYLHRQLGVAQVEPLPGTPPDVRFSCPADPAGDCLDEDDPRHVDKAFMLAVGRPSADWIAAAASVLDSSGAQRLLVLTIEIGNYFPRQRNIVGDKEVYLGTNYSQPVPWLTSLDDAVQVLQVTGVLVGRDGRAIRIGAEGLMARRSGLAVTAVGGQRLLSDADIEQVRTLRRNDLPDRPLVWQLAIQHLVRQLTGR